MLGIGITRDQYYWILGALLGMVITLLCCCVNAMLFVFLFQMQLAASSCVMIGVEGAGLQWLMFMPRGCTLIEIAWPSKHWGFFYYGQARQYGIRHYSLTASPQVNWNAYEKKLRNGTKVLCR